jgi:GT2 family glycosyltransferase
MTTPVDVSVVIVAYRSAGLIPQCLHSLRESAGQVRYETIVVDNASPDDSAAVVRATDPTCTVVELDRNAGFAGGVNAGIRAASGDYVLLLNPDVVLRRGSLAALVSFARANPDYQVYGGRTVHANGSTDPRSCWGLPSLWSFLCFATMLSTAFRGSRLFDPESLGQWQRDSVREVGAISGALLLAPRRLMQELHGLDERYFMYSEDIDFAVRARAAGARPVITPDAVAVHDAGASSTTADKAVMVLRGKVTYTRLHWSPMRARTARWLLLAGVSVRAKLASRSGNRAGSHWPEVHAARRDWSAGWPVPLMKKGGRHDAAPTR